MKGAGAHFHVVGLQDHAALIGPEPLQSENEALERTFRAHMGRQGVHRQNRSREGVLGARDRIGGGEGNQGDEAAVTPSLTSPRLRGEVEIRAKRGFRVRGSLREGISHRRLGTSPSPQPSPRKRGAREF